MQANSWHYNYSNFICPFKSGDCIKEGKKLQKIEKSVLHAIKSIFHSFWKYKKEQMQASIKNS